MIEHGHEVDRLESLQSYGILDTEPEAAYDELARLAALVCDAGVSAVALVDRDRAWFKSVHGVAVSQIPRQAAFCRYVISTGAPLVVTDARRDARFAEDPLVTGPSALRSYAGVPLIGRDGLPVGTVGVIDRHPRDFSAEQLAALSTIAHQVVTLMEIGRLDRAMGRNASSGADELTEPVRLRAALDDAELHPHYQPIVELCSGRITSFEALLRWEHPSLGLILPGRFLPAIESSGLIMPVGRHVLHESIRLLAELQAMPSCRDLGMAVNVSLTQLAQPGISDTVIHELESLSVPAHTLALELTESAALFDDRTARRELDRLHEVGVRLSIDDYGTGYSSLMRVLDLPITTLKLDRSLTQRVPGDRRAIAVVRSTVDMAASLGISVVAEGIELGEQQDALLQLGCRFGQGYLFGRPSPGASIAAMVASQRDPAPSGASS